MGDANHRSLCTGRSDQGGEPLSGFGRNGMAQEDQVEITPPEVLNRLLYRPCCCDEAFSSSPDCSLSLKKPRIEANGEDNLDGHRHLGYPVIHTRVYIGVRFRASVCLSPVALSQRIPGYTPRLEYGWPKGNSHEV